eukprot:2833311-Pleurochrysis_carterae.AAC.1
MVNIIELPGCEALLVPSQKLLADCDGVLAGVLRWDRRQGAASAPTLKVGNMEAALTLIAGKPLTVAVALSVKKDHPQEVTLQEAMRALGLQWSPLRNGGVGDGRRQRTRAGERAAAADSAIPRGHAGWGG